MQLKGEGEWGCKPSRGGRWHAKRDGGFPVIFNNSTNFTQNTITTTGFHKYEVVDGQKWLRLMLNDLLPIVNSEYKILINKQGNKGKKESIYFKILGYRT